MMYSFQHKVLFLAHIVSLENVKRDPVKKAVVMYIAKTSRPLYDLT